MSDEESLKDAARQFLDIEPASVSTDSVSIGEVTAHNSAHIKAEEVGWLVSTLADSTELQTDEVRLETTEGVFVFTAEDGTVVVRHETK